ncbi:MAG: ATP-dependent DNA helicase RecG [Sulfurimonas sp.]|nr:MAG: ATP-dependent DNA helicase RecG [Sulfurimonas sp.]
MNLTKDLESKFKKLGISSWFELALNIPHSYEDLRLHNKVEMSKANLIDASIESVFRATNSIQITFYAFNLGFNVTGVLFRPKPYMMHQFKVGDRDYYYGLIDCKTGNCTMAMPKKVSSIGHITARYKCALRSDVMLRLVQNNLSLELLESEGLDSATAKEILNIHFPKETINLKEMSEDTINALKYLELFSYMKQLSDKRRYFKTLVSQKQTYIEWMDSLPFTLTQDQILAIKDIQNDFSKDIACRRMIVGDVGSGKTMVILASAYMMRKHRSILMAPTTILANQLYQEVLKFLPSLNSVLITNKSKKEDLSQYDFIIGTHALLYRELPKAALVMVDEQHRFGTAQRNKLEKLVSDGEKKPHFLQFSATPIPRTLAMIETSHIDVSLITSTPFKKDITSMVIRKNDFKDLLIHIKSEIKKDNQVLLVYPLVVKSEILDYQSIDEARSFWEKNFDNVYVTHGKDKEKEQVLLDFSNKGDMLIATTVVEVGISLPRLSTVIIVGAERLGLSTLHQLRGRVSRTGLKGYCYLYTNKEKSKRLEMFTSTISGFDIANLDLKYRKSGDLLKGTNQSGTQFKWIDLAEDFEIVKAVKSDLEF